MGFVISNKQTVGVTLASNEMGVVTEGGMIAVDGDSAIEVVDSGLLMIAGDVFCRSVGIDLTSSSGESQAFINITETGTVIGGWVGIQSANTGYLVTNIYNAGQVSGGSFGALLSGAQIDIINSGAIASAGGTGLALIATDGLSLNNSGLISGETGIDHQGAGNAIIKNTGTITGIVNTGGGNDLFDGAHGVQDAVYGGLGDDQLIGGEGRDTLYGGDGSDALIGGSGDDILIDELRYGFIKGGSGDDFISGGNDGGDYYGGDGGDSFYGGDGSDNQTGGDGDDTLGGGGGKDTQRGGEGDDQIFGLGGGDSILGGRGDDLIVGGTGNDTITGGAGDDRMQGGVGSFDVFVFSQQAGVDRITDFRTDEDRLDLRDFGLSAQQVFDRSLGTTAGVMIDLRDFDGGVIVLSVAFFDADELIL